MLTNKAPLQVKKLTLKQYEQELESLIDNIKTQATPFAKDTAAKQKKRIERAKNDIFYFCQTYFPHYCEGKFGKAHKQMHAQTEIKKQITGVAGFRGLGKSAFLAKMKPIYLAVFKKIHFCLQVAENNDDATSRVEEIRAEFLHNERIINDFGELIRKGEAGEIFLKSGCKFLAKGYKQKIRGLTHGAYRPDYIVADDLEDHKSRNEDIAAEKLKFIAEECYGAFGKNGGVLVWLGNLTHPKSALNLFKKSCDEGKLKGRKFLCFKAIEYKNGKAVSGWKEYYTVADFEEIKQAMGSLGFERHYQMNPIVEGLRFKSEWFRYYKPDELPPLDYIVTYTDPSLGSKKTSDYKAIITLGWSSKTAKYYVLNVWIRKTSISPMLNYMYQMDRAYNTRLFMESNFWQKVLWDYIEPVAKIQGYTIGVTGVENRLNKELRIEKLQPLFEWGNILFPAEITPDLQILIDHLLSFPSGKNDDGPDALAGAIEQCKNNSTPISYRSVGKRLAGRFSNIW